MDIHNIDISAEISETKEKIQELGQRVVALENVRVALRALNGTEGTLGPLGPNKDRGGAKGYVTTHRKKRKPTAHLLHHKPTGMYVGWTTAKAIEHFIKSRNEDTRIHHIASYVFGRKPNSDVGRKCRAAIASAIRVAPALTTIKTAGGKGGRHVRVIIVKQNKDEELFT